MKLRLPLFLLSLLSLAIFSTSSLYAATDYYVTLSGGSTAWDAANLWSTTSGDVGNTTWNTSLSLGNANIKADSSGSTLTLPGIINVERINLREGTLNVQGGSFNMLADSDAGPLIEMVANSVVNISSNIEAVASSAGNPGLAVAGAGKSYLSGNVKVKGAFNVRSAAELHLSGTVMTESSGTGKKTNELSIQEGTLYLDNGADVTVGRFVTSDGTSNKKNSQVYINDGAKLTITGTVDNDEDSGAFLLARWNTSTSLFQMNGGLVTSEGAVMRVTNNGQSTVVIKGGELKVKGLNFNKGGTSSGEPSAAFYLGDETTRLGTGVVNIGESGIQNLKKGTLNYNPKLVLGQGTIKAWSNWQTNADGDVSIDLDSEAGTTFDTDGFTITINHSLSGGGRLIATGGGNLVLTAASSAYTGTMEVISGTTLNLSGAAYSNSLIIRDGTLQNASGFTGSANIQAVGNVALGGINGAQITNISTYTVGATVSGINGNVSISNANLTMGLGNLTSSLDPSVTGAPVVLLDSSSSTLAIDSLNLGIGDTSLSSFLLNEQEGVFYFEVTNGILGGNILADPTNTISFNPYLESLGFTVTGVEGGRVVIQDLGDDVYFLVAENTTRVVDMPGLLDFYAAVIVEGTLNVNLQSGDGLILNNLGGNVSGALINTGNVPGVVITLNNDNNVFSSGSYYAGNIDGSADLIKSGQYDLVIGGRVGAGNLTVSGGALSILGGGDVSGHVGVETGTSLGLGGMFRANDLTVSAGATLDMVNNAKLTLCGDGSTSVIDANAGISGNGIISLCNNVTLSVISGSSIGDGISIEAASSNWIVNAGEDLTFSTLAGTGALNLNNTTITLTGNREDQFIGSLGGSGNLVKTGTGTQILEASATSAINLNVQDGVLVLNRNTEFGNVTLGSNTTTSPQLSINQNITAQSLTVSGGSVLNIGGADGTTARQLLVNGNVSLGSNVQLNFVSPNNEGVLNSSQTIVLPDVLTLNLTNEMVTDSSPFIDMTVMNVSQNFKDANGDLLRNGTVFDSWDVLLPGTMSLFYSAEAYIGNNGKSLMTHAEEKQSNELLNVAQDGNAISGANLIWAAGMQPTGTTLDSLLLGIISDMRAGNTASAERSLAASVGSPYTGLLGALSANFNQQQMLIRDRLVSNKYDRLTSSYESEPYSLWFQGNGMYSKLDSSGYEAGYKLESWGGTIGFDTYVSEHLSLGAAFTASFGDYKSDGADYVSGDLDSYYVNLFAGYQHNRWNHLLVFTAGWGDADLNRNVYYGNGGSYSTRAKTDSSSFGALYEVSYDIYLNREHTSRVQPFFDMGVTYVKFDDFSEESADTANLHVKDLDKTEGFVALGSRYITQLGSNILGRESFVIAKVQVSQNIGREYNRMNVAFDANPGFNQRVRGAKIGRTGFQAGGTLHIPVASSGSIFIDAMVDLRSRATGVFGSAGYRIQF